MANYVLPNGQKMLMAGNDPANGDLTGPAPTGYSFTHLSTEYQYFPEEYFSGADVTVYFGDIFVEDVTGLQFMLAENVQPLYGYADYAWSKVARGTRIVQGEFRIAFREAGYLYVILDHLAQLDNQARPTLGYLMTNQEVPNWHAAARQTIENMLNYYHGDSGRTIPTYNDVTEDVTSYFDWPEMGIGATDTSTKGAVSQLQNLLISHGLTVSSFDASTTAGAHQRYWDGQPWAEWNGQVSGEGLLGISQNCPINGGHWPNYGRPSKPIQGDYYTEQDATLERRLIQYYKLINDSVLRVADRDDPTYIDGKYGDYVRRAVAWFQCFAEHLPGQPPGDWEVERIGFYTWLNKQYANGWAGWVDDKTAQLLSLGSAVTGTYDVTTKAGVWNFQKQYAGQTVTGPNGETATVKVSGICDDATRWMMSKVWNTKTITKKVKNGDQSLSQSSNNTDIPATYMPRAKRYEQEIWGRSDTVDPNHLQRTYFYDGGQYIRSLKETGFDIYITYGPIGIWAMQNQDPDHPLGNLPGDPNGSAPATAPFPNTVKAIRNVQLTGVTQILSADGKPIEEVYSFIARDLD